MLKSLGISITVCWKYISDLPSRGILSRKGIWISKHNATAIKDPTIEYNLGTLKVSEMALKPVYVITPKRGAVTKWSAISVFNENRPTIALVSHNWKKW